MVLLTIKLIFITQYINAFFHLKGLNITVKSKILFDHHLLLPIRINLSYELRLHPSWHLSWLVATGISDFLTCLNPQVPHSSPRGSVCWSTPSMHREFTIFPACTRPEDQSEVRHQDLTEHACCPAHACGLLDHTRTMLLTFKSSVWTSHFPGLDVFSQALICTNWYCSLQ